MRIINCEKCKIEVKTIANNRKYCDKCVKITDREHNRNHKIKNRKRLNKEDREYYKRNKERIIKKQLERRDRNKYRIQQLTYRKNEKINICSKCGKKVKTDFHHISYEPNLFIEVCRSCHKKIHFGKDLI